ALPELPLTAQRLCRLASIFSQLKTAVKPDQFSRGGVMASFNLLSWNIQILGPTKIGKDMEPDQMSTAPYNKPSPAQKAALFQTIGETVAMLNADIVSILEVCSSTAGRFERLFLKSVEKATRAEWAVETVYSNKSDVYFIAYRKNAGFEVLLDKNGDPVKGLTHKDKDGKDLN